MKKENKYFSLVVGYEAIVNELKQICGWFKDDDLRANPDFYLPRGILLYGRPGNGKTMIAREFINALNVPIITIEGNTRNVSQEVREAFLKLKEEEFAVLFIDELDLLVYNNETAVRIFQSEMDGLLERKTNYITVATTNSLQNIPSALRRSGRFDRVIELDIPNRVELQKLYEFYSMKSGLENIDYQFLSRITRGVSCADTKSIINDALLRKGVGATTEDIEDSYNRIIRKNYEQVTLANLEWSKRVAVHEIGHIIMIKKHEKFLKFYRANFTKNGGGACHFYPTHEEDNSYEYHLADIEVALGGYYAEKLIWGHSSMGVIEDLERARNKVAGLINKYGYISPIYTLPDWNPSRRRPDTEGRRRENEKLQKKLFKKIAKKVERYIRNNKNEILKLSHIMVGQGYIKDEDVNEVLSI